MQMLIMLQQLEMRGGSEGPYTLTSHTSANSSQKGPPGRYLRGAEGGPDSRRDTERRFQLNHEAAAETRGQPAKAA